MSDEPHPTTHRSPHRTLGELMAAAAEETSRLAAQRTETPARRITTNDQPPLARQP